MVRKKGQGQQLIKQEVGTEGSKTSCMDRFPLLVSLGFLVSDNVYA